MCFVHRSSASGPCASLSPLSSSPPFSHPASLINEVCCAHCLCGCAFRRRRRRRSDGPPPAIARIQLLSLLSPLTCLARAFSLSLPFAPFSSLLAAFFLVSFLSLESRMAKRLLISCCRFRSFHIRTLPPPSPSSAACASILRFGLKSWTATQLAQAPALIVVKGGRRTSFCFDFAFLLFFLFCSVVDFPRWLSETASPNDSPKKRNNRCPATCPTCCFGVAQLSYRRTALASLARFATEPGITTAQGTTRLTL